MPTFGAPILTNSGFDLIAVEFNLSLGDQVKVPEVTVLQMKKGTERNGGWVGGSFQESITGQISAGGSTLQPLVLINLTLEWHCRRNVGSDFVVRSRRKALRGS